MFIGITLGYGFIRRTCKILEGSDTWTHTHAPDAHSQVIWEMEENNKINKKNMIHRKVADPKNEFKQDFLNLKRNT